MSRWKASVSVGKLSGPAGPRPAVTCTWTWTWTGPARCLFTGTV